MHAINFVLANTVINLSISEEESKSTVYVFYKAKYFQAFHYCYKLAKDCRRRIEKIIKSSDVEDEMHEDLYIRIGIVGKLIDADYKLISEGRAKKELPEDGHIWTASPLLCFQNDLSPSTALQWLILKEEIGCNTVNITKCSDDKNDKADMSNPKNIHTEEELLRIITTCLNKPLKEMLERWLANLDTKISSRQAAGIKAEVEAIRKQMEFDDCDESDSVSVSPVVSTTSVVPDDVKNYLFSNSEVYSFGIWMDSSFKVFVKNDTDEKTLMDELTNLNQTFIEKYHLEIEKRKIALKQTLKQGESIQAKAHSDDDEYCEGTLGGFVTKVDDKKKIYALTCNHLFPEPNQLAYIEDNQNIKEIGFCVYTTREKSCDFAAIEINDAFVSKCDIALRRDDKKKTNAKVNTKELKNVGIVHKIGKATDVTTGMILSPEYYDKVMNDSNRGYIFLVKGTDGQFSEKGDSGSLVFCRPRSAQQTHVDILGIVYGNNLIVHDDEDDDDDERTKHSPSEGAVKTKSGAENTDNGQYPENISCCYRIDTALDLFKKNYSKTFEVKFQDDLPLTSLSQSANSDDSNEEHSE